jgi:Zn-dependent peptidase ImmA (M78 family)
VHIEAGNRSVNTLELAELAEMYQRPIVDFLSESTSQEEEDVLLAVHRIAPDFRDNPQVNHEVSRNVEICRRGVQLRNLLSLPPRSGPPAYDHSVPSSAYEAVRQGAHVAIEERRRIGLGGNPIPDMADLIASQRVWASGADLPDGMSGLFLRNAPIGMVILVNYSHPRARKRFSYAHEYAHALLDRNVSATVTTESNRSDLIEVRANAFAAAFLMPEGGVTSFLAQHDKGQTTRESIQVYDVLTERSGAPEIEAQWRSVPGSQRITCQVVAMMAHYFRVSYQAAVYRLKSLHLIGKEALDSLLRQEEMGLMFLDLLKMKEDLMGTEPGKPDRELTREVVSLAVEAYSRGQLSKKNFLDTASLLDMSGKELLKFAEICAD